MLYVALCHLQPIILVVRLNAGLKKHIYYGCYGSVATVPLKRKELPRAVNEPATAVADCSYSVQYDKSAALKLCSGLLSACPSLIVTQVKYHNEEL